MRVGFASWTPCTPGNLSPLLQASVSHSAVWGLGHFSVYFLTVEGARDPKNRSGQGRACPLSWVSVFHFVDSEYLSLDKAYRERGWVHKDIHFPQNSHPTVLRAQYKNKATGSM